MTDWMQWHESYEDPTSTLFQRLQVVRGRWSRHAFGVSVLQHHPRARDVTGRLVELEPRLAERARAFAPSTIEVMCADAGESDAYEGAVPVNLLLIPEKMGK